MNFEELLKNDESRVSIKTGEIVEGRVIDVKPDEILVDISYKSDGIIPRSEYTNTPNADLTELVHVDDPITAKVVKTNDGEGSVLLSYKRVAAEKANEKLEAALESGEILTGKVVQVVSGGLNVMYDETRVFIPASLVSDTYEKNLDKYLDQDIEFVLTEYQPKKRRIIGNRKQIVAARKAEAAKALFDRIEVGMIVEGVVKNVTSFGAFIDLGGADGLLHISEMSWGRVDDPKSVLKVGDTVKAFIKNIDGEKIALSLKFDDTNPWLNAAEICCFMRTSACSAATYTNAMQKTLPLCRKPLVCAPSSASCSSGLPCAKPTAIFPARTAANRYACPRAAAKFPSPAPNAAPSSLKKAKAAPHNSRLTA